MREIVKLWAATDEDNVLCELNRIDGVWILEMVEGPFSGYPALELNRTSLKALGNAIDIELMTDEG